MGLLDMVDDGAANIVDRSTRLRAWTVQGSNDLRATDARTYLQDGRQVPPPATTYP